MVARLLGTALLCTLAARDATPQGLPPYQSVNPFLASRSGLHFQPYVDGGKPWQFRLLTNYGSLIEFTQAPPVNLVLDAEVLRLDATITRNIGDGFLAAEVSYNNVYDGWLDGFLDWYHNLTGLQVKARTVRPRNQYAFAVDLPNGTAYQPTRPGAFLGDIRLTAGHRHTRHWQTALSVTLPTGPAGFGREAASVAAVTTVRTAPDRRVVGEFSAGLGYTPRKGELERYQRSDFYSLSSGLRVRLLGKQAAFINLFYQSSNYEATRLRPLDQRELTLDYGFLLKAKKGPEWFLGMTEDLEPKGPAIDLAFRIGARW